MSFNRQVVLAGFKMLWALVLELANLLAILVFGPPRRASAADCQGQRSDTPPMPEIDPLHPDYPGFGNHSSVISRLDRQD